MKRKPANYLLVSKFLWELGEDVGSWFVSPPNLNPVSNDHLCPLLNTWNLAQEERCYFFLTLGTGQGHTYGKKVLNSNKLRMKLFFYMVVELWRQQDKE